MFCRKIPDQILFSFAENPISPAPVNNRSLIAVCVIGLTKNKVNNEECCSREYDRESKTVNFWKKLFGVKEPPKADIAQKESPQPPATPNPQSTPILPIPVTPPQPTLLQSVSEGDLEKVKALLKDYPELVFSQDSDGQTPLHLAAWNDQRELVELLLVGKAEVNAKDKFGQTPLHLATDMGHKDVAKLLLASQAEVNAKDNDGRTPLHMPAAKGYQEVAELLLASNVEVNAKDKFGQTPLHYAASNDRSYVVELLRQHGGHE